MTLKIQQKNAKQVESSDLNDKTLTNKAFKSPKDVESKFEPEMTLEEEIEELLELLPPSVELNVLIEDRLKKIANRNGGFISAEILNKIRPQVEEETCDILTRILIHSISFFPGPIHKFIQLLNQEGDDQIQYVKNCSSGICNSFGSFESNNAAKSKPKYIYSEPELQADASEKISQSEPQEGPLKKLRKYLTKRSEGVDFGDTIENIRRSPGFIKVKDMYENLSLEMQMFVLQKALTTTIKSLRSLPRVGGEEPIKLYEKAIDEGLINSLRQDARVSEDILSEVKKIFLVAPAHVQARVLLTAMQHPVAKQLFSDEESTKLSSNISSNISIIENNENSLQAAPDKLINVFKNEEPEINDSDSLKKLEQQADLVRELLTAGGVVAVKLGQMLAEHPRMPLEYQKLLGSLREKNDPMKIALFWNGIPTSIRDKITHLGECLGTGSVKQVHAAKLISDPLQKAEPNNEEENLENTFALGILRNGVEDEALSSITALETSEEIGPVAKRLGRLVFGEFNLFEEGEALTEFALTKIGTHELFRVVEVVHHSPRCLIEEIAAGDSVAKILSDPGKSQNLKINNLAENERKEIEDIKKILTEYHLAVFSAFVRDGLVHSDIHLGNAVVEKQILSSPNVNQDAETKVNGFVLFDVGQFERISGPDAKALLWTLSAISSPETRITLRDVALDHLVNVSSLNFNHRHQNIDDLSKAIKLSEKEKNAILRKKLDEAFEESIQPDSSGVVPEKKVIYILMLRNAEKRGVILPKGAFAVAKMIDCIISQQDQYGLFNVVDSTIEVFLKTNMSWKELAAIAYKKCLYILS